MGHFLDRRVGLLDYFLTAKPQGDEGSQWPAFNYHWFHHCLRESFPSSVSTSLKRFLLAAGDPVHNLRRLGSLLGAYLSIATEQFW